MDAGTVEVAALAQRIVDTIAKPFRVQGSDAFVGVSIGIVVATSGQRDSHELSRKADIALYEAKSAGRNRAAFYEEAAERLAAEMAAGRMLAVLCDGDPFFYGSFMHLWRRLAHRFPTEVVPGVTGMAGAWARADAPISWGDDVMTVVPGTLGEGELTRRLADTDAAVIMKLGRNLPKVRRALQAAGLTDRAIYVERATMAGQVVTRLAEKPDDEAPYFSMILVPGEGRRL